MSRPPFWRDVRVLTWAFQIAWSPWSSRRLVPRRQLRRQRRRHGLNTRLHVVPRPAGRVPDPVERLPPGAADAGRDRRGLLQHAAPGDHRHRAGDGPRHADRRRPPVAELHPPQRDSRVRRVRPQRPAAGAHRARPSAPSCCNAFPPPNESWELGPIAVLNVRGSSVFWFEGDNWKAVVVVLLALIVMFVVARWRRAVVRPHRTARRASALWAIPIGLVVAVVAWIVLGLGVTTPELEGSRVIGGITMTPAYFAALLALVVYTSSHIAEIVRASIQAVPRGQGEAADALALSGFQRLWYVVLPQAMRIGMPPIGNQYLNLTKNSSLAAVISFPELTKVTQLAVASRAPVRAVLHPAAAHLPRHLAGHLARRQPRQPPPGDRGAVTGGTDGDARHDAMPVPPPEPQRPPAAGPADWVRRNLFRSVGDGIVTVVAGLVVLLRRCTGACATSSSPDAGRSSASTCKLFLVGNYPVDELWRIVAGDRRDRVLRRPRRRVHRRAPRDDGHGRPSASPRTVVACGAGDRGCGCGR